MWRRIKTWQLVLLLLLALFLSAIFLRLDNVGMVERYQAVKAADASADDEAIRDRLYDLQVYSAHHMNASTGELFLTEKYERDGRAIVAEVQNAAGSGSTASSAADAICRPRFAQDGFFSQAYLQCIKDEADKAGAADDPITEVEAPDPTLYRYEFYSPLWAFGFAGISVLMTGVIALMIVVRLVVILILRLLLRWRYRRA